MLCRRFYEGFLEGVLLWNLAGGGVLRRVLRSFSEGRREEVVKAETRLPESTTPFTCTLSKALVAIMAQIPGNIFHNGKG